MTEDIEDCKVALITGSSSGIGAATAKLFAERCFKVAVTGREAQLVNDVVTECDRLSPYGFKVSRTYCSDTEAKKHTNPINHQGSSYCGRFD